ncbi:MAG: hypothetical protein PHS54_05865 [Clostridia bacterium]|nr:hypothetical protein [Clostridia bacterium]
MKKRIIKAIIIFAVLAAIGLGLFLIFKDNSLNEIQANNFITRAAIDMDVIDDYDGAPELPVVETGTGEDNIINLNSLPSISEITLASGVLAVESATYTESVARIDFIVTLCKKILDVENVKQNQVYEIDIDGVEVKVAYKLMGYEVVFVCWNSVTEKISLVSFFYDSIDSEYEFICVEDFSPEGGFASAFGRIKGNADGLVSYEAYSLTGIVGTEVLTKIEAGEGTTNVLNLDYENLTIKNAEYNETTNADDHFIVSSYIYQVYSNYNTSLEDLKLLITEAIEE